MKGTEASILVDEYIFDGSTSQIELQMQVGEGESTNLASTAGEYVPILPSQRITQQGWVDGVAADDFQAELDARLANNGVLVTVLFGKSSVGCVAYTIPDSQNVEMNIASPMAGLMTVSGNWGTTAAIRRGIRIWEGEISATGGKTSQDNGVGATTGGYAFLHVTGIDGTASDAEILIESSPDNSTWSTEATFTFSDLGGYTATLSGTVGRYLRVNVSDLGGADSLTLTAVVSLN